MNETVPKQAFDLLQSHFDLLLKLASGLVVTEGGVIVFLFLRLLTAMTSSTDALNNNTAALKELKDGLRDGR